MSFQPGDRLRAPDGTEWVVIELRDGPISGLTYRLIGKSMMTIYPSRFIVDRHYTKIVQPGLPRRRAIEL